MTREARPITAAVQAARFYIWETVWQLLTSHTMLIRFVLVGAGGYLIYQTVLFGVYDLSLLPFLPAKGTSATILLVEHGDVRLLITTLVATALALVGVFTGHNLWTFRDRDAVRKPLGLRFVQFTAAALISALGIITVTVNVLTAWLDIYHFIALPIGVLLGFIWDLLWNTQFIWRRARKS